MAVRSLRAVATYVFVAAILAGCATPLGWENADVRVVREFGYELSVSLRTDEGAHEVYVTSNELAVRATGKYLEAVNRAADARIAEHCGRSAKPMVLVREPKGGPLLVRFTCEPQGNS